MTVPYVVGCVVPLYIHCMRFSERRLAWWVGLWGISWSRAWRRDAVVPTQLGLDIIISLGASIREGEAVAKAEPRGEAPVPSCWCMCGSCCKGGKPRTASAGNLAERVRYSRYCRGESQPCLPVQPIPSLVLSITPLRGMVPLWPSVSTVKHQ